MNRLVQLLESLQNLQFYNMQETSCWGSIQKKWKRKKKKKLHTEIGEISRGLDDDNLDSCQIATVYISAL